MPSPDPSHGHGHGLPRPRALARLIVRWTQREDAAAFESDLEVLARREVRRGLSRWAWGWGQILSTLRPSGHAPGGRGRGRQGTGLRVGLALRLAFRGLRRDPATALTAVLILSLGVAAPTVFFSILWGVGFRSLPVPEGERVVRVEVTQPAGAGRVARATARDAALLRALPEFEGIGTYTTPQAELGDPDGPGRRFPLADLDPQALELLRVGPVRGRVPVPDEGPTLLVGEEAWEGLAETLDVELGDGLAVNGVVHTAVGLLPASFGFPTDHAAWRIVMPRPDEAVSIVGRLAPGVSEEEATRAAARVWDRADPVRPAEVQDAAVRVVGFTRERGEGGEMVLFVGLVLVGLALLAIAVANASNLLLVRAVDRSRPLAIQGALGAGRGQLALQTLLESLLLAAAGGVGGFGLAAWGARAVQAALGPRNFGYHWSEVGMTPEVTLFTVLLVLGTAVLAGTLPVIRLWRSDLRTLTSGSGGTERRSGRVGDVLVSLQLALSCAALVGAGLMVETTAVARSVGESLPLDEVILVDATLDVADDAGLAELHARLASVRSGTVQVATGAPGYFERVTPVRLPGRETDVSPLSNVVSPGFFDLFGIERIRGRGFGSLDRAGSAPVAVVNRSWVARYLPGSDPLGVSIRVPDHFGDRPVSIVGVVEDVPLAPGPEARLDRIYLPFDQLRPAEALLLVRAGDPGAALGELRSALGGQVAALGEPLTLREGLRFMTRVQETFGWLIVLGGASGFVVALVGLYGLLAFRIRGRRREFGIRLALGADRRALSRSVLTLALRQIAPAVLAGAAVAWLAAPLLGILTLGQDPRGPGTYLGVTGVFLVTALAAAWVPARRAARVDPVQTLKAE